MNSHSYNKKLHSYKNTVYYYTGLYEVNGSSVYYYTGLYEVNGSSRKYTGGQSQDQSVLKNGDVGDTESLLGISTGRVGS